MTIEEWLAAPTFRIGQLFGRRTEAGGFVLCHHDDRGREDLPLFDDAEEIARFDDAGNFRPLRTAPNLRHGWELKLADKMAVREALEIFYPGRLAAFRAWASGSLSTTPLRATLGRQTGMYRVAAKISDAQIDQLVGHICRSDGGCLRTILWRRDATDALPSSLLPPGKFTPAAAAALPLLCQEACNLLVAEARKVVKGGE